MRCDNVHYILRSLWKVTHYRLLEDYYTQGIRGEHEFGLDEFGIIIVNPLSTWLVSAECYVHIFPR